MTTTARGRAALVTGGSSGIGLAIARMLLEEDFDVTIASSSHARIEAAAAELGGAHTVVGDVSVEQDCRRIVAAHGERCGRLDVLVNSAGILRQGSLRPCSSQTGTASSRSTSEAPSS
jgi:NAD(P)-dependent dehydrogenase (short-subunit alcohol dehydrogenase family)